MVAFISWSMDVVVIAADQIMINVKTLDVKIVEDERQPHMVNIDHIPENNHLIQQPKSTLLFPCSSR